MNPRLIMGFVGFLAVAAFVAIALSWRNERNRLLDWQGQVVSATVDAAGLKDAKGNPANLKPKDVPAQIRFLGEALNAVRLKTAQAQADDAAHARAVEQHQTKVTQEVSNDYQRQLAAVRADYAERVRRARSEAAAHLSSGRNAPVPGPANPAGRPDAAAAESGLPSEDALIATEQAIQLRSLQDWVRQVFSR